MKKIFSKWFVIVMVLLAACSGYQPEPLSPNHPAHSGTAAESLPLRSQTLAYTKADIPSARAVVVAQGENQAPGAAELVSADGKVVAVVPSASQLVVEHGEIKGFMDAMTMGYRVESSALLEGLKFGDRVRFTIDVPKKTIVKIEKMK